MILLIARIVVPLPFNLTCRFLCPADRDRSVSKHLIARNYHNPQNRQQMKWSDFWHSNIAFVLKMFFLAALLVVGIIFGVQAWLQKYTRHGQEVEVPDVTGMNIEESRLYLQQANLGIEVVDSTYNPRVKLGTIVEQNPPAHAHTKSGRSIYVIMNSRSLPTVAVPRLYDMSYRQAETTLLSLGFELDSVVYQPSEFPGLVLDVTYNGESVEPLTRLTVGSTLQLVVGQNAEGDATIYVPQLIGKNLNDAKRVILQNSLIVGAVNFDVEVTEGSKESESMLVYHQEPAAGKWVVEGSRVTLYLSADPGKRMTEDVEDEDFF